MFNSYYILLLVVLNLILFLLFKNTLYTEQLYYSHYSEKLFFEQITNVIENQKKWEWLIYVIMPLFLLIKVSIISKILDLGCFIFNQKLKFKQLFNSVVKAEFIFLLVIIFKTAWFYFFKTNYTLEDLQYFYPLSALNIVGYEDLEAWWVYPLQVFNLFELAYWFILAYLLGKALNTNIDKGLHIVASSYGVGLLIWVVGIMFFTLNAS